MVGPKLQPWGRRAGWGCGRAGVWQGADSEGGCWRGIGVDDSDYATSDEPGQDAQEGNRAKHQQGAAERVRRSAQDRVEGQEIPFRNDMSWSN